MTEHRHKREKQIKAFFGLELYEIHCRPCGHFAMLRSTLEEAEKDWQMHLAGWIAPLVSIATYREFVKPEYEKRLREAGRTVEDVNVLIAEAKEKWERDQADPDSETTARRIRRK